MGIGNSRGWFGQQPKIRSPSPSPSPRYGNPGRRNYRGGCFRQRRCSPATQTILPAFTQPISYQPLYSSRLGTGVIPVYTRLQPISSPYLPIPYNNYPPPLTPRSHIPPQYMMMPPQRGAPPMPTPYMSPAPRPPAPMPYMQPAQMQPAYNNIGYPVQMRMGMPGGNGYYPSSIPPRLITDWTGGGQISPGFLGPPI